MKQPIIISAIGHAILVALMILGLPLFNKAPLPIEDVVPVDLVERIEEVAVAPPSPQPKPPTPEEKPEPPKPPEQAEVAPTPPEPEPDIMPDLDAVPQKKPEPKKVEEPKTPAAAPQKRPQPPKKFDMNRITALLDKTEDEDQPKEKTPPLDISKLLNKPNRSPLETEQLAASLRSMIRAQVEPCWSVPAGARYAEDLKVTLRIFFLPNGALAKAPEIVDTRRMSDDFYRVAAESARRAVQRCAPLKLPPESYDVWRESELVFDPSDMLGG